MKQSFRDAVIPVLVGIFVFIPVYGTYYFTHPYPSLSGGLFLMMGQEIVANEFVIPATVPYYTASGIPLGYPPLMLTIAGGLLELGLSPFTIARVLPGVLMCGALIAFAIAATTVLQSRFQGTVATIVFATSPSVLEFTVTAGGTVRAAAMVLTCAGIYTAVRLFRTHRWTWLLATAALFGATIQTHPIYTVFFATNVVALWVGTDRSVDGLVRGGGVAVGGLLLAAPWWVTIVDMHGLELFFTASQTHGGVGYFSWYHSLLSAKSIPASPWPLLSLVAVGLLSVRGRFPLVLWFFGVGFLTGRDEYLLTIGAIAIASAFGDEVIGLFERLSVSWLGNLYHTNVRRKLTSQDDPGDGPIPQEGTTIALVCLFLISAYASGAAISYVDGSQPEPPLPMFVQDTDMQAAEWVTNNTDPTDSFVVIGDVAEWFPLIADRTSLVVPQGTEWSGNRSEQIELRADIGACRTTLCLSSEFQQANLSPEYVYLSRHGYHEDVAPFRWQSLGTSLKRDPTYAIVYENKDVIIAERIVV